MNRIFSVHFHKRHRRDWRVWAAAVAFAGMCVVFGAASKALLAGTPESDARGPGLPNAHLTEEIWPVLYGLADTVRTETAEPAKETPQRELPQRTLSPDCIPYDGQIRAVSCWGDSMMYGCNTTPGFITLAGVTYNISYATTPDVLSKLTGLQTYNLGVNGETSREIALRQGGLTMVTDRDIDIEGTGIATFKLICLQDGDAVYMEDYSGYNFQSQTNICIIEGSPYYVTNEYDDESQLLYGTDVHIQAGTPVRTLAAVERQGDILVLEIGSNGGWDQDYAVLIAQYDAMIQSAGCKYYIIVGDTDDPALSADNHGTETGAGETPWELALKEAYGDHFLNMRLFLIQNGLRLCGLEPTPADTDGALRGEIPQRLRSDWTHFNAYGYYAKARGIYIKGQELGYWE